MSNNYEFVVVILSEHWIKKHLGKETLFDLSNVQDLEKNLSINRTVATQFQWNCPVWKFLDSAFRLSVII